MAQRFLRYSSIRQILLTDWMRASRAPRRLGRGRPKEQLTSSPSLPNTTKSTSGISVAHHPVKAARSSFTPRDIWRL